MARPRRRAWRWLLGAVLAVVMLGLVAWLALPPLLKWQLEKQGSELLGREVRVGQVRFVPFTLALTLEQLSIGAEPAAASPEPLLQVDRILVDLDARSLLRLAPVVEAIDIDAPRLRLARLGDGHYDIDDLVRRLADRPAPPEGQEPARFALFNLQLRGGRLRFDDRPVGRVHEVADFRLDLPFLSNLPDHIEIKVEPRLAFVVNGTAFDAQGQAKPFAEGRASEFRLRVDGLRLEQAWAYVPRGWPLQPVGGALWSDVQLHFEQHAGAAAQLRLAGQVELRDLALREPGATPLLSWRSLRLRMADVQPLARRLKLEALHVDGLVLDMQREPDGRLNLQRLAAAHGPAPAASAPAGAAAAPSAPASAADARPRPDGWELQLPLLELNEARVSLRDQTLAPAPLWQLDPVTLRLKGLRWPAAGDAPLQFDARLLADGRLAATLRAEGTVSDQQARVAWRLEGLDVAAGAPYLKRLLRPRASGRIDAEGEVDWARGAAPRLAATLTHLHIGDLRLSDPVAQGTRRAASSSTLHLPRVELADLRADLLQRRLTAGSLLVQRPSVDVVRAADGTFNLQQWAVATPEGRTGVGAPLPAPPAASGSSSTSPGGEWRAELRQFRLEGGRVRFSDAALPASPLQLSALRARADGLVWPLTDGAAPWPTQLSGLLSQAGSPTPARLDWAGTVGLKPMRARGRAHLERFPVHVFEPYVADALPVVLRRLEAGFKGEIDLRGTGPGWAGRLRGDALLADLLVAAKDAPAPAAAAGDDELLRWNAVAATGLDLEFEPQTRPLLKIDDLRIADYFARVVITEEGRLNLQTAAVSRRAAAGPAVAAPGAASAPLPASAPAAGDAPASVSTPVAALSQLPIDFVVGATRIENARIDFNDRFIRPNYRADLSELNGSLGRLDSRSRDPATVQLKGRVAGTGLLEIEGAVNPAVNPPALDLRAKAHDIELPGLTPYSAKYAGYPIERGKLSVNVAYKIEADGKLAANNRIIVNQLTFGPKTDSPSATKLPVKLAVALLQDANGVIDLDLPVSGSINDPKFSLSGLIWKVIANVLNKALTAPFSLLAGSGGKDLSVVEFKPGTAQPTEGGMQAIDGVAKALAERPTLKLTISGEADAARERGAMQRAALEQRLLDEQRRERARGGLGTASVAADAPLPPPSAAEREQWLRRIYADTRLPDKPRNSIGLIKDIPPAEMEALLLAAIPVDAQAARQLAVLRGRTVRDALLAKGLAGPRLFLAEPKPDAPPADNAGWVPRAQLALGVD